MIFDLHCCQVPSYSWSVTTPSHTLSCSCTVARYPHTLGQSLHRLILYPVPTLLSGTLILLVSHYTFSYSILFLHCCQVHLWSATAPSHIPSCSCTVARYPHTLGQSLHLLILYPVPALLPGTLILLVSHCTFSYSILFLHCCQVHLWSATAPSHIPSCSCTVARYPHTLGQSLHLLILYPVPALLPGTLILLVSHYTFSYSILFLHCCQVPSYSWSVTTPSHTLSCSCTVVRYPHTLGQSLHLLILYPVPALLPGTPLVSHCTFSYSILFLHCCQVSSYSWSVTAPSHTLSCSCTVARYPHTLGQSLHLLILYPVPALLPGTLILLVSHCTFSYSILFLHCCQVSSYSWSVTAPSHTLSCSCTVARYSHTLGQSLHRLILYPVPALLPGTLILLVSHCTISYSILFLHCCQVPSYSWSATAPSHTLSCSCTVARYPHTLGKSLHRLIFYPVPALLPGTLILLVSHCTVSYSILFWDTQTHNPAVLWILLLSRHPTNLCLYHTPAR